MSTIEANKWITLNGRELAGIHTWVNFNADGVVTIRDSLNVASIIDNGVGSYSILFTASLDNANYCVVGNGNDNAINTTNRLLSVPFAEAPTVVGVRISTVRADTSADQDWEYVFVQIVGGIN